MPRSGIVISGDLDTWIRELPELGRGDEVEDRWSRATHRMLLESRSVAHVLTGQLRATSYSETERSGRTQVEGRVWWPATSDEGFHYPAVEFGLTPSRSENQGGPHDTPRRAFVANYDEFRRALTEGLEDQVRGWS